MIIWMITKMILKKKLNKPKKKKGKEMKTKENIQKLSIAYISFKNISLMKKTSIDKIYYQAKNTNYQQGSIQNIFLLFQITKRLSQKITPNLIFQN